MSGMTYLHKREKRRLRAMVSSLSLIAGSLVFLYFGADLLVKGSSKLALRLGVAPLIVGLTIVAFGTSMPEMIVSLKASFSGNSAISLGNVLGSNIFNLCVILGLASLIQPLRVQSGLVRRDVPAMIASAFLMILFFIDGVFSPGESLAFLALFFLYTGWTLQPALKKKEKILNDEFRDYLVPSAGSPLLFILLIGGGLGLLAAGAHLLVAGSITLARLFGVSEAVIGLTIVAAGTSLPELATSLVAALKKEPDISVGNIIGSNIFNTLAVLGGAGAVRPLTASGITWADLGVFGLASCLAFPFFKSGFRLSRLEGGLLLALYAAYVAFLWPK